MRLLLLTALALGLAQAKAKVEVVGLHVSKPAYKEDKELAGMDSQNPVRVDLLVVLEEPGIIKIDDKKCKIAKFADDKGTDLLGKNSFGDFGPIGPFPKISKDQKAVLLEVQGKNVPAAGAKAIQLEGSLAIVVGKGQEASKQDKVELKKGASFKVGTIGFSIDSAGKPDFGDAPLQVTLITKDAAKIAKLRFLDGAGKEIESKPSGSSSMSLGGETSTSWTYDLKQDVNLVTVEATLWKQVATVDVPVKLSISVGF